MHNNYSFMNISIRAPAVDSALNLLLVEKNCSQHGALATFVHAGHCRASHSSRYVFHLLLHVPSSQSSSSLQVTASANRTLFFLGLNTQEQQAAINYNISSCVQCILDSFTILVAGSGLQPNTSHKLNPWCNNTTT